MRHNICSSLALLLLMLNLVNADDESDKLYDRYISTITSGYNPEQNDTSWLTQKDRQILIDKANLSLSSNDSFTRSAALQALVMLGDKTTISSYIQDYHDNKLEPMASIQLLPNLMDDVFNGSTVQRDRYTPSIMDHSTLLSYQILRDYPKFPKQTRDWAAGAEKYRDAKDSKSHDNYYLREWWNHNKSAVLAGQYQEADWLPVMEAGKTNSKSSGLSAEPQSSQDIKSLKNDDWARVIKRHYRYIYLIVSIFLFVVLTVILLRRRTVG
jgi:hypothetical protein